MAAMAVTGRFCMQSFAGKGMALVRVIFSDIADAFADVTLLHFKRRGYSPQNSTFHLAECLQVWLKYTRRNELCHFRRRYQQRGAHHDYQVQDVRRGHCL